MTDREAIAEIYRQVHAPQWASPNLDGLADVLRDLSWLPAGEVEIDVPTEVDDRLRAVLHATVRDTADRPHRVVLR